jgi:hypothetical protein
MTGLTEEVKKIEAEFPSHLLQGVQVEKQKSTKSADYQQEQPPQPRESSREPKESRESRESREQPSSSASANRPRRSTKPAPSWGRVVLGLGVGLGVAGVARHLLKDWRLPLVLGVSSSAMLLFT